MWNKNDDARDLVRKIMGEGLADDNLAKTVMIDGVEVRITKSNRDSVRFDLPGMRKAYVLMSGRLYERDFILDLSGPEFDEDDTVNSESPGLSLVEAKRLSTLKTDSQEESGRTELPGDSNEGGNSETGGRAGKTESSMVQQHDYKGNIEEIDSTVFSNKIECGLISPEKLIWQDRKKFTGCRAD